MPPADSSSLLVARFLKAHHYDNTYEAFIEEAGLPNNAGDVSKGDLTLEQLLEEKKTFDLNLQFEKLGTDNGVTGWSEPAPKDKITISSLPSNSNLLSTSVETFKTDDDPKDSVLLASTADRRLHIVDVPSCSLRASFTSLQDSPTLSCAVFRKHILLSTAISGQLIASDLEGNVLDRRRDHAKYVVKVAIFDDEQANEAMISTAGWDNKIVIYKPTSPSETNFNIGEPIATITLPSKPESMHFLRHPDTSQPVLLLSRADSSFVFYYSVETSPRLLGKQNLAPHSTAWVAFTPSSLALCPTDPTLLAVGTNSIPHMKVLIVRLLIPHYTVEASSNSPPTTVRRSLLDDTPVNETQASQARTALAVADREDAAIQIHCTSMSPQTAYSTPTIVWRPDGSGVWVNGDDGAIRGIEASTGKVMLTLKGHEEGSKVRCLWAGMVEEEEWLVSGGFDHKLIVWKAK